MMKEKVENIVFQDRKEWRRWLRVNHDRKTEIWLVLPKKSAGGDSYRVYYNQAVEEALCFGWIDSRIKPLDATRSLVRFMPRKNKNWTSSFSLPILLHLSMLEDDQSGTENSASRCGSYTCRWLQSLKE